MTAAVTSLQWFPLILVLHYSLQFSFRRVSVCPGVPHFRGIPPFTFASCSLSGYSLFSYLIWEPCLSNLHPSSKLFAPMSSGYRCKPLPVLKADFRHKEIQIGLSCPEHAGPRCLAQHCNLHASFQENIRKGAKCKGNSKDCWHVMIDKDLFFCLLIF